MDIFEKLEIIERLDRGAYLYRCPGKQKHEIKHDIEHNKIDGDILVAKNPNADYQLYAHVMNGSRESWKGQFYSSTKSFDSALDNRDTNRDVLIIDVKQIIQDNLNDVEFIDISTPEKAKEKLKQGNNMTEDNKFLVEACSFAVKSEEVVIKGKIPPEYYRSIPWKVFDFFKDRVKDGDYKEYTLDFIETYPDKNGQELIDILDEELKKDEELKAFIHYYEEAVKLINNDTTGPGLSGSSLAEKVESLNADFNKRYKGMNWENDLKKVFLMENNQWSEIFKETHISRINAIKTMGEVFNAHKNFIIKRLNGEDEFLDKFTQQMVHGSGPEQ